MEAQRFDVWALISMRYVMRVLGPQKEFYNIASKDPMYAKIVLPSLERRGDVIESDELDTPMSKLESHMTTQLMKAVDTLRASNAKNRAKGGSGGDAGGR